MDDKYIKWLSDFAPIFRNLLTSSGSVVIELGNTWEKKNRLCLLLFIKL